jgi:hypothetical protein
VNTSKPHTRFQFGFLAVPVGVAAVALLMGATVWKALLLAVLLSLPWAVLKAFYTGVELSADRRQFRSYFGLLGLKIGSWQPLPPVVGVTLKYYSKIQRSNSRYSTSILSAAARRAEELVVLLSVPNSPTGIIVGRFALDDVNPAIDFAHDLADELDVGVNMYLPPNQFKPL